MAFDLGPTGTLVAAAIFGLAFIVVMITVHLQDSLGEAVGRVGARVFSDSRHACDRKEQVELTVYANRPRFLDWTTVKMTVSGSEKWPWPIPRKDVVRLADALEQAAKELRG
jgi:hypothetical protein